MRNNILYGLFSLAVLLFVAKPFIGFDVFSYKKEHIIANTILVKSFAKRKPEDLRDAETQKTAMRIMLMYPPVKLLASITFLLGILFPVLFRRMTFVTHGYLNYIHYNLIPASQPYILTGKLTI